jgi:hypothetical protein
MLLWTLVTMITVITIATIAMISPAIPPTRSPDRPKRPGPGNMPGWEGHNGWFTPRWLVFFARGGQPGLLIISGELL